jgi:uncharacterized protein YegL
MHGERIRALNGGLRTLRDDLITDNIAARRVEVAVVTFDSEVRVARDFATANDFNPPELAASGATHMAAGIECALDMIEARKAAYQKIGVSYYRPWVFMITDGKPEGETDEAVELVSSRLRAAEQARQVAFFAIAVEGADVRRLAHIAVRTPLELEGLDFHGLFHWLSASMQSVSKSQPGDKVVLPPTGWIKRIAVFITQNEKEINAVARVANSVVKTALGLPST